MSFPPVTDCWFLTGSTASGKTEVGIALAVRLGAEIVSLDSMALFRGMDIGTAKPTAEQRKMVPHHLIDIVEPHEDFSLASYLEAAHRAIAEIHARGRPVLFVGGTPLYLKGLLRGVFQGPKADWAFRDALLHEAKGQGPEFLHRRLMEHDPATAARLHPNDTRRILRALEVFHATGEPISKLQQQFAQGRAADECRVFVLSWPRAESHRRIERRVKEMFAAGLVDEVRRLLAAAGPLGRTARQAVGYREVIEHVEGRLGRAETIELVERHTRQLAKRQETWFRSLSECRFVPVAEEPDAAELAEKIVTSEEEENNAK